MIKSIHIKNFKSVVDLSLDLGTFNVLIGENGCGKSNILEAIAFGAAASADKLDYEFLGSRGIRATNPEFMYSAFSNGGRNPITINFSTNEKNYDFDLVNEIKNPKVWSLNKKAIGEKIINSVFKNFFAEKDEKNRNKLIKNLFLILGRDNKEIEIPIRHFKKQIFEKYKNESDIDGFINFIISTYFNTSFSNTFISNFIVYSPEQSSLRKFEETNQIYPLGIKGEGLFQYLKELTFDKKNKKTLIEIKENLMLLDWYEDFDLAENLMQNEFSLKIKDKYLYENLQYFDQRSTNEGFLFLLFYSTLFISKGTPTFFAIDNIDASLNPKMCMQLTKNLAALAKKHKKQVIVTTHNPAILDGLNLKDDNQRLFVISRNSEGHTRAERINHNDKRTMKLSEIWMKGFIGGLPDNF